MENSYLLLANGESAPFDDIAILDFPLFRETVLNGVKNENCYLAAFFVAPYGDKNLLISLLGDPAAQKFRISAASVGEEFPSLTTEYPGFNRFEREIFEEYGIRPAGHPWLKPIRFENVLPGDTKYFSMQGSAIHEVAVGPVHAGVIEPGHFRFECMGEDVHSLEISLGYQHRGVEKMLLDSPEKLHAHIIETAAGDSSIASAINYCTIIESLAGISVDKDSRQLRMLALELERCANHIGDLGALAGDVAFLPTASFCGRIRGDYLNMTAMLCGNRFGRNFIVPGGCRCSLDGERKKAMLKQLQTVAPELWNALDLMFESPTVLDRLENTGLVSRECAVMLGLTGVAARACGLSCDTRKNFPLPGEKCTIPVAISENGDVMSRASVRRQELYNSHDYIFDILGKESAENPAVQYSYPELSGGRIAVSAVEAWRGMLCHVAVTGENGKFSRYKIVDPSFHNWSGLAMALRGEQISNFPICNKSFNLSYCGHDL